MYSKDYYSILGVISSAEEIVIRAAYKALAQRYHPDKYQGDPYEAKTRMQEINEAYSVLSDPEQKQQYDKWLDQQHKSDDYETDEQDDELASALRAYDNDWNTACEIFPDLQDIVKKLNRVSSRLAMTYKILMLESKKFEHSKEIANAIEQTFFENYFGKDPDVLAFARRIVYDGHKQAAKALNKYIRVVGSSKGSQIIIEKICSEYGLPIEEKTQEPTKHRESTKQTELNSKSKAQRGVKQGGIYITSWCPYCKAERHLLNKPFPFLSAILPVAYKCKTCNGIFNIID